MKDTRPKQVQSEVSIAVTTAPATEHNSETLKPTPSVLGLAFYRSESPLKSRHKSRAKSWSLRVIGMNKVLKERKKLEGS